MITNATENSRRGSSPINRVRQRFAFFVSVNFGRRSNKEAVAHRIFVAVVEETLLDLVVCPITELINSHRPRVSLVVVSDGFIAALLEDGAAEGVFLLVAAVGEVEVADIVFVGVVLGEGVAAGAGGGDEGDGEGDGKNHRDDGENADGGRAADRRREDGGHLYGGELLFFKKKYIDNSTLKSTFFFGERYAGQSALSAKIKYNNIP